MHSKFDSTLAEPRARWRGSNTAPTNFLDSVPQYMYSRNQFADPIDSITAVAPDENGDHLRVAIVGLKFRDLLKGDHHTSLTIQRRESMTQTQRQLPLLWQRENAGRQRLRWNGVYCQVEALCVVNGRLRVEVAAAGTDPMQPTHHDRTHAAVSTFLALKQPDCESLTGNVRTYLRYESGEAVAVECDLDDIAERIVEVLDDRHNSHQMALSIPSPLLAFLLDRC